MCGKLNQECEAQVIEFFASEQVLIFLFTDNIQKLIYYALHGSKTSQPQVFIVE